MSSPLGFSNEQLVEMAWYKMPFGTYKGRFLSDLPEPYYVWFKRQGFPQGKLGSYMATIYEMKLNGIEGLLKEIRSRTRTSRG